MQLYIRMKNALTVVIFPLFAIGVFVDGTEASNVELESVTEGDSVTLKSGVIKIQTHERIEWRFNEIRIAKISIASGERWVKPDGSFTDRLQLDSQTGDLKISNIKTTDSGRYKLKISSSVSSETAFTVKVVPAVAAKTVTVKVTVLEGDSVTLPSGLTDIQTDDVNHVIQWRFGQQKSPVAEIDRMAGIFSTYDGADGRFRDRLQLDNQTGSLIITNTRTTDTGLYEVEISRSSSSSSRYTIHTIHHTQSFSVTISVTDAVKSVSVKEGETVTLQTVTEIQNDDLIVWMFGDFLLADFNKADRRFFTSDGPDERFSGRLKLDRKTGSLNIINTRTTDSGDYQLKIISSRHTINRRISVTVTGLDLRSDSDLDSGLDLRSDSDLDSGLDLRSGSDPDSAVSDSGLSRGAVAGIVFVVVVLLAAVVVAGVVIYYRSKISELERRREENGGNHKKQDTDGPANEETELYGVEPIE